MSHPGYLPPVATLLTIGDPRPETAWPDYLALGLTREQVPDLLRMVADEDLNQRDGDDPAVWAPLHAWRALGQLRANEAVALLLARLDPMVDDDYFRDELPTVLSLIGPEVIPALEAYLAAPGHEHSTYLTITDSLGALGQDHPAAREACVAILTRELETSLTESDDPEFNACVIVGLIKLKAVEAAPTIARAYEADAVDEFIVGDWEEVQIELGLLSERLTPKPFYDHFARAILAEPPARSARPAPRPRAPKQPRPRPAEPLRRKNKKKRA